MPDAEEYPARMANSAVNDAPSRFLIIAATSSTPEKYIVHVAVDDAPTGQFG